VTALLGGEIYKLQMMGRSYTKYVSGSIHSSSVFSGWFFFFLLEPTLNKRMRQRIRPPRQSAGTKRGIERLAHRPCKNELYSRAHVLRHIVLDVLPVRPREYQLVGSRAVRAQHLFFDPSNRRDPSAERDLKTTCQKLRTEGRWDDLLRTSPVMAVVGGTQFPVKRDTTAQTCARQLASFSARSTIHRSLNDDCAPWRRLRWVRPSSVHPQEGVGARLSWHPVFAVGPARAYL
jgi:hypothetical protein